MRFLCFGVTCYVFCFFFFSLLTVFFFFFFSSRRRHTRLTCDWSSDVCSSDLLLLGVPVDPDRGGDPQLAVRIQRRLVQRGAKRALPRQDADDLLVRIHHRRKRSEERRVGKRVELGGRRSIKKKKQEKEGERVD